MRRHDVTTALGRARAKSGHIKDVDALAGYVDTRRHGRVAFAILVNDPRADDGPVDDGIDATLDILAGSLKPARRRFARRGASEIRRTVLWNLRPIGTSLIIRVETQNSPNAFATLGERDRRCRRQVSAVDTRTVGRTTTVRDVTVTVSSDAVGEAVQAAIARARRSARSSASPTRSFSPISAARSTSSPTFPVKTRADLSTVYTPGVARVALAVAEDPSKAFQLTIKRNTVAVISDGTAVLGLGDIGPLGALPVMEGKCMLFKQFAGIDAFPITLDTKNVDEIVDDVRATSRRCSAASISKTSRRRAASRSRSA